MSDSLFSTSWHRVRDLQPRLRAHARIHRHRYRGETWYVLHDPVKDRFHRFTPATHKVIGLLGEGRSLEEVWRRALEELGDDAPTQDEMIHLLAQLHAADVLQSDVPPDVAEIFERGERFDAMHRRSRWLSPFAIRIPLLDPERFLERTLPVVRPFFGRAGLALWLAVVVPALGVVAVHWSELTEDLLDRVFTPQNLAVVWLLFPVLKAVHELGHGYATKAFGGEVHEMGVMFLVFTPVPYVDASSSWAFRSKLRRALVGAGGVIAELFVAALGAYVWVSAEPGVVRAAAYNVLVISGATTLLFNANPLLRYDGYYILSDLIEIPNLRARANRYIGYLAERYLFANPAAIEPDSAPGERPWFVTFAVCSFAYRMVVVAAIALWILDQFFLAGLLLGGFAVVSWLLLPLYRALRHLLTAPSLARVRGRAAATGAALLGGAVALLALLPMPFRTLVEGVVWVPDESLVRARVAGFVDRVVATPGARVQPGDLLIEMRDPALETEARVLEARVREFEARLASERPRDPVATELAREELAYARQELARVRQRLAECEIRAATAGSFVIDRERDLPGRFVNQGQLIAHVVDLRTLTVRAVVPQDDLDLVRHRTDEIRVRTAEQLSEVQLAVLRRFVPAASDVLPSPALGSAGGGEVPVDPTEPRGNRAVKTVFEVELEVPAQAPRVNAGGRVYVRFDHGREPLALQWYRRVRQLFLSRLHV
jgi:putative peptide zinc metalloprotease protein